MYNHMEMALSVLSFVGCFWVASSSVVVDPRNLTVTTGQTIKLRCIFSDTEVNWFSRNGTNNPVRIASSDDNACWKEKPTVDGNSSIYREADGICVLEVNNLKHNFTYLCTSKSTPKQDQAVVVVMAPKSSGSDCEVDTATSTKLRCKFNNTEVSWLSRSGVDNPIPIAFMDTNACSNEKETIDGNYTVYREAEGVCVLEVKNLKQNLTYMCKSNSYKEYDKAVTLQVAFDISNSIGCEIYNVYNRVSHNNDTVEMGASTEQNHSCSTYYINIIIPLSIICVIGLPTIVFFACWICKLKGLPKCWRKRNKKEDKEADVLFINENNTCVEAGNLIQILQSLTNHSINDSDELLNKRSIWDYIDGLDLTSVRDVDGDIKKNMGDLDRVILKWNKIEADAKGLYQRQLSLLKSHYKGDLNRLEKEKENDRPLLQSEYDGKKENVETLWKDSHRILNDLTRLARNAWDLTDEGRSKCPYHKKLYVIDKIKGINLMLFEHWVSCRCEAYRRLNGSKGKKCTANEEVEENCIEFDPEEIIQKIIIEDEYQIGVRKLELYRRNCNCPKDAPRVVQEAVDNRPGANVRVLYSPRVPNSNISFDTQAPANNVTEIYNCPVQTYENLTYVDVHTRRQHEAPQML